MLKMILPGELSLGTSRPVSQLGMELKLGSRDMKQASKRALIAPRGDKRYIRRDAAGRIKESDDVSRSLSQDRRRKAKKAAKPGQGDRGDRKPASKAPARKKTRAKR
jgi:hypothetical protein